MDDSPPSSLPAQTPPSSPIPCSPASSPAPKKLRRWQVFAPDAVWGERQASRSTYYYWKRAEFLEQNLNEVDQVINTEESSECEEQYVAVNPTMPYTEGNSQPASRSDHIPNETFDIVASSEDSLDSSIVSDSGSLFESLDSSDSSIVFDCGSDGSLIESDVEMESILSESDADNFTSQEFGFDAHVNSSESSDEANDISEADDNARKIELYSGSQFTVDEAILDLLDNHLTNRETKKNFQDHLAILHKYLPNANNLPSSVYHVFKYVIELAPLYTETEYHYCANCLSLLPSDNEAFCLLCNSSEHRTFYGFSIENQLKHYFENCRLHDILRRSESFRDTISDICDGSEYKRVQRNGQYNITLMLNTDGVAVSQSSKTSLYPVLFTICEIPPELRASYMILSGVWCDTQKPLMNIFLRPFVDSLVDIYNKGGVSWRHPDTPDMTVTSIVTVPAVCADAPVRAQLQNIKSHNGLYSCNTCEQKMEKIPLTEHELRLQAQGKKVKCKNGFLFKDTPACLRTNQRMLKQAQRAVQKRRDVKGVKGPSILSLIPYLDLGSCVFGEYMHLVCLGIVRRFMNLWFNVNEGAWFIGNHMNEVDEFLLNIKPPSIIGRLPRGVSDMKLWKASEFRAFLLHYSLPIVSKFLSDAHLQHWMLFVEAIYLLLQEDITMSEIDMAAAMLRMFVRDVATLYQLKDYVYNLHELLHLPLYVKRLGPLWATSAFIFEKYNGFISQLIHGTKNKGKELINNLRLAHGVQILRRKVHDLNFKNTSHPNGFQLLNKCSSKCLTDADKANLYAKGLVEYEVFSRVHHLQKREIFTSLLYQREKKRNNYTVFFQDEEQGSQYGEIKFFVRKTVGLNDEGNNIYAGISVFSIMHTDIFFHEASHIVNHIVPVLPSQDPVYLIPFQHVLFKVIRVGNFVCRCPNFIEKNL